MTLALVLTTLHKFPFLLFENLGEKIGSEKRPRRRVSSKSVFVFLEKFIKANEEFIVSFLLHMKLVASSAIRKRFYFLARSESFYNFLAFVFAFLLSRCCRYRAGFRFLPSDLFVNNLIAVRELVFTWIHFHTA